ncbi:hypothetical protein HDV05_006806 [Chytridiales sp. JEL 0842]|nr:hypothetical protein HDV05_006806 [Chytridiales sp. JEL 0842]
MRREMQEIIPNVFLGPYSCARDRDYLKSHGITHLLCVMDKGEKALMKMRFPGEFVYYDIEVSDSPMQNLIPFFSSANAFIKQAVKQEGGRVLVYCNNGLSRSPSVVVAYMMEVEGWECIKAFTHVQHRRFCINPNDGFKLQLREYETLYQARNQISKVEYSGEQVLLQGSRRRPLSVDDDDEMES